MIDKPGVYDGVPEAAYHADSVLPEPSLSCSIAQVLVRRSPAHAAVRHPRLSRFPQEKHSDRFDRGKALHEMLLGGEARFLVVDAEDWRGKEAKADKARAREEGCIPLLAHQHDELRLIVDVVRDQVAEHPDLRDVFRDACHRETTVAWRDGTTGVWCRCRPDLVCPSAIVDFKLTGTDATPEAWASRTAHDLMYPFRAAFYVRGWHAVTRQDIRYRFCVIEDEPPYALSVFEPTPETLEKAGDLVERAILTWEKCLRSRVWPGYEAEIQWLELPTWVQYRDASFAARLELGTTREIRRAIEMHRPRSLALEAPR